MMVLWLVFGSIFGVWNVFQSPGLDFRLIALGARRCRSCSTRRSAHRRTRTRCCRAVVVLAARDGWPRPGRGHRLRRRRALSLAIGWFAGLVLGGAWAHKEVFWWPAFGTARPDAPLLPPWPLAARSRSSSGSPRRGGSWTRFGLADPARRREFCAHAAGSRSTVAASDDRVRPPRSDRAQPRRAVARPRRSRSCPSAGSSRPRAVAARFARRAGRRASSRARCGGPAQTAAAIAAVRGARRSRSTTG